MLKHIEILFRTHTRPVLSKEKKSSHDEDRELKEYGDG